MTVSTPVTSYHSHIPLLVIISPIMISVLILLFSIITFSYNYVDTQLGHPQSLLFIPTEGEYCLYHAVTFFPLYLCTIAID